MGTVSSWVTAEVRANEGEAGGSRRLISLDTVAVVEFLSGIRSFLGFINNTAGSPQPQPELGTGAANALFLLPVPLLLLQEGLLGARACSLG